MSVVWTLHMGMVPCGKMRPNHYSSSISAGEGEDTR